MDKGFLKYVTPYFLRYKKKKKFKAVSIIQMSRNC